VAFLYSGEGSPEDRLPSSIKQVNTDNISLLEFMSARNIFDRGDRVRQARKKIPEA
jgi:hypothetical protein